MCGVSEHSKETFRPRTVWTRKQGFGMKEQFEPKEFQDARQMDTRMPKLLLLHCRT